MFWKSLYPTHWTSKEQHIFQTWNRSRQNPSRIFSLLWIGQPLPCLSPISIFHLIKLDPGFSSDPSLTLTPSLLISYFPRKWRARNKRCIDRRAHPESQTTTQNTIRRRPRPPRRRRRCWERCRWRPMSCLCWNQCRRFTRKRSPVLSSVRLLFTSYLSSCFSVPSFSGSFPIPVIPLSPSLQCVCVRFFWGPGLYSLKFKLESDATDIDRNAQIRTMRLESWDVCGSNAGHAQCVPNTCVIRICTLTSVSVVLFF